jgi:CDGSH-type Zn-finger protein
MKIKILKNGPYLVSGGVPLSEKIIVSNGYNNEYKAGRDFPLAEKYELCRCGHSKNAPFCDGSHARTGFDGTETASSATYNARADLQKGPDLYLTDDGRCAYARFCHREQGTAWSLTDWSDDPQLRDEAITAATECPSGRLAVMDIHGNPIEPELEPSIEILQDSQYGVSGPLYVKGNIPIESAKGFIYEVRNRVTLCRCGASHNKPFCNAMHISIRYQDKK